MPPEQRGPDARVHERRPVLRRGVIVHEATGGTFACTILDLSVGGARLQLFAPDLPDTEIRLVDREAGTAHGLRIAWRAGPLMGVSFTSSVQLP